jgi:hypothetical protein
MALSSINEHQDQKGIKIHIMRIRKITVSICVLLFNSCGVLFMCQLALHNCLSHILRELQFNSSPISDNKHVQKELDSNLIYEKDFSDASMPLNSSYCEIKRDDKTLL